MIQFMIMEDGFILNHISLLNQSIVINLKQRRKKYSIFQQVDLKTLSFTQTLFLPLPPLAIPLFRGDKPTVLATIASVTFMVAKLECYDDSLNNLMAAQKLHISIFAQYEAISCWMALHLRSTFIANEKESQHSNDSGY